jgi:hypothetical protein
MTRHTVARPVPRQARRETPVPTTVRVHVQTRGGVDPRDVGYARYKVDAAMKHARDPILLARARLTHFRDPALDRPDLAQANLDLNGVHVRAQVVAPTMREAIDALHDRLLERLEHASSDWQARRGHRPVPGEWRHQSLRTDRPPSFPRPAEERQIVRHKAFAVATETVEEAAFDMELLDYGFHLFTEEGSEVDSVLYRVGDQLRLAQLEPRPALVTPGEVVVRMSPGPAPVLTIDAAISHLEQMATPFVFFRDAATDRGSVLYHRYDGHYGLIVPVR